MGPLELFEIWYSEENSSNELNYPSACCLSTNGLDGYPNARFVSLKQIVNNSFVITGPMNSRKGQELKTSPNAALSFWWTSTKRQIRIQGDISPIPESLANQYFEKRNFDSKIVSTIFNQGQQAHSLDALKSQFEQQKNILDGQEITRPKDWGGIFLKPIRMEFMQFKDSRLHERTLYQWNEEDWEKSILQP